MRLAALLFAALTLGLQLWRMATLSASYDQGIFLQVLWSGLRGHPFESTLSSQLSSAVIHGGLPPAVGYLRLGQHYTPLLVLWIPLVGLLGGWALPLIQVGLVTAAGLVLHRLALRRLDPEPASWIATAFFCAQAVIAPTLGNFTDLCQLPLLVFLLLLALEQSAPLPILVPALLIPLVREDTGVLLASVGLWLALRRPRRRALGVLFLVGGVGWVLVVTNLLMPGHSDDNARRFMVENFGQYLGGQEKASSLEVVHEALARPLLLLRELVSPPGQTLRYLAGQGLPLLFVPFLSVDAWLLMGPPLVGLLLAQGANNPLSLNLRYTLLVVPGLFAGSVFWWQRHRAAFASRSLRRLWAAALVLSLLFTFVANPNRALSFVIPDSVHPWVYTPPGYLWRHARQARTALALIPPDAPAAATTYLVPPLARREVLVRFPRTIHYLDRAGRRLEVAWIAVDLDRLRRFAPHSRRDRATLENSVRELRSLRVSWAVRTVRDGVVVLQRGGVEDAGARAALEGLLAGVERP